MHKITTEEAILLNSLQYEQKDEAYVLCYCKDPFTPSQKEVISTLVNKEILLEGDDREDPYFWMHQDYYRMMCDIVEALHKSKVEEPKEEKPTKVFWQDLMFQEFKDLITVEGLSMDAARDEMMVRTSKFLDVALFHFLELITNSKLSDLLDI